MERDIKIANDISMATSILLPDDLTNEQVCKIIIELAKTVLEENGEKNIKFKKADATYDVIND